MTLHKKIAALLGLDSKSEADALVDIMFHDQIGDLLYTPEVQGLAEIPHHMDCPRLAHSLHVSYFSFRICRRFGLDARSAARAGLLHDLFVHGTKDDLWGYFFGWWPSTSRGKKYHPLRALENAERLTELNDCERDIIKKHMWPFYGVPRYWESVVVTMVDKACAMAETVESLVMPVAWSMMHMWRRPAWSVSRVGQ